MVDACLEGWRRVFAAPALTVGVYAMTGLIALPFAIMIGRAVQVDFGNSVSATDALTGWPADWAAEFSTRTGPLGRTLTHEILGFGGTMAPVARMLDGASLPAPLFWGVAAYVVSWIFISGGILDRLARGRRVGAAGFFAASGVFFFRFLRLGVLMGAAYAALFVWVRPWLFGSLYGRLVRDLTVETQVLTWRATLYAAFLLMLASVSLVSDFAKVRMVVEDRRSAIAGVGASWRFIRRRLPRVVGLYLLNVLVVIVIWRLWLQSAPGASWPGWIALGASQAFLLARLWARLSFLSSEIVFFQRELAHADYAALPEPVWPDSPSVEGIRNLRRS